MTDAQHNRQRSQLPWPLQKLRLFFQYTEDSAYRSQSGTLEGVASNTAWLISDRVLRLTVGLALGILIARHLGPADYGLLSYAISLALIFGSVASFGLEPIVVRELSVREADAGLVLGTAIRLRLLLSAAAFTAALSIAAFLMGDQPGGMVLVAILSTALFFQSLDVLDSWFQSRLQSRHAVTARAVAFVLSAAVKIWLLLTSAGVVLFAIANLIEAVLAAMFLCIAFQVRGPGLARLRTHAKETSLLLRESAPMAASMLAVMVTMQVGKVMLGWMAGARDVGIYSVASQLSSVWYALPMIIGVSLAPVLSRMHATGHPDGDAILERTYRTLSLVAITASILTTLLSTWCVELLYGAAYSEAARVLAIHVWCGIFIFHVSIRTRWLVAKGQQGVVTIVSILIFAACLLLSFLLIPRFQSIGAALASLGAWMLGTLVFPLAFRDMRPCVRMFIRSILPWLKLQ